MPILAPDKFKGTLTAMEVATALAEGWRAAAPRAAVDSCPIADGGEGTLDVLAAALRLELRTCRVMGPSLDPIDARFAIETNEPTGPGRRAVVQMSEASGLHLLPAERRDPLRTTTFGAGQLIAAALEAGARRIIVGLGGSATCDGGAGLAQALGVRFLDQSGRCIEEPLSGGALARVRGWLPSPVLDRVRAAPGPPFRLEAAYDVDAPLLGPSGAARLFAPQKGATPDAVELLERALADFAEACGGGSGQEPGDGAAGGCGFGLRAFCGAELCSGAARVLEAVGLEARLSHGGVVVTGEGRFDASSLHGKGAVAVARLARRLGRPVFGIFGQVADGMAEMHAGPGRLFLEVISLSERFGSDRAIERGKECLRVIGGELGRRLDSLDRQPQEEWHRSG